MFVKGGEWPKFVFEAFVSVLDVFVCGPYVCFRAWFMIGLTSYGFVSILSSNGT